MHSARLATSLPPADEGRFTSAMDRAGRRLELLLGRRPCLPHSPRPADAQTPPGTARAIGIGRTGGVNACLITALPRFARAYTGGAPITRQTGKNPRIGSTVCRTASFIQ